MTTTYLLTTFVVCLTPGTGVVYTVAAGLSRGRRAGLLAALACTLGMLPHFALAVGGVAAVLRANPLAFTALAWAGAAYLVYLAWTMWRDRGALDLEGAADDHAGDDAWTIIRRGVAINLLNPKLSAFFFAFLPQFVPADAADPVALLVLLGATAIVMTLVVFAGYAVAAAAVRDQVLSRPRVLDAARRVFALTFVALAARLALTPA